MKYLFSLLLLSVAFSLSVHFGALRPDTSFPGDVPEGYGDREQYLHYEMERSADPATGSLPLNIHEREAAFVSTLPTRESAALWLKPTADEDQRLGLEPNWTNHAIQDIGGRTRAFAYDVGDENIFLAGGVGGGIWRSTNTGTSWTKTTSATYQHSVSCLAQDTRASKRKTWYYGSGEYYSTGGYPTYRYDIGEGIFKSNDGGLSWSKLPSTAVIRTDQVLSPFHFIHSIATDPARQDSDIVYAACYGAIMRSNDGGTTWKAVLGSAQITSASSKWTDVVVTKEGIVYASLSNENSTYMGVWRSKDGITWQRISSDNHLRARLAFAPSNPNVVWLLSSYSSVSLWKYTYLSGNGSGTGGQWENRTGLPTINAFQTYCLLLAVSPNNEERLVVGGSDLYYSAEGFRNNPEAIHVGGYSDDYLLTRIFNPVQPRAYHYPDNHPDMHTATFLTSNPKAVILGCDGGIFFTTDISKRPETDWVSLNKGYNVAQFYSVALDPVGNKDGIILGGAQDNGSSISRNDGKDMLNILGADGMVGDIAANHRSLYPSAQNGRVYRLVMNPTLDTLKNYTAVYPSSVFDFVTPMRLDPNNNKILYMLGAYHLWRNSDIEAIPLTQSTNAVSQNWSSISLNNYTVGTTLSALGIAKSPANRVYIGSRKGTLLRIDNVHSASPTITTLTSSAFPTDAFINCICVDPENGDDLFVVFSNYGVRSLFHSTDGGGSWEHISGNLEEKSDGSGAGPSCRWFDVLHYQNRTIYIVGTTSGLFTTTKLDGNNTVWVWEPAIGNVNVNMIRSRSTDGFVTIATHGRGIFSTYATTLSDPNSISSPGSTNALLHPVYPNPCYAEARVHITLAESSSISIALFDMQGRQMLDIYKGYTSAGEHSFAFSTQNLVPGMYFCRMRAGNTTFSQQLSVVR